jgi:hypothetical protein
MKIPDGIVKEHVLTRLCFCLSSMLLVDLIRNKLAEQHFGSCARFAGYLMHDPPVAAAPWQDTGDGLSRSARCSADSLVTQELSCRTVGPQYQLGRTDLCASSRMMRYPVCKAERYRYRISNVMKLRYEAKCQIMEIYNFKMLGGRKLVRSGHYCQFNRCSGNSAVYAASIQSVHI